tara:strand:+ start:1604 stop:2065 length:462 start_codon:yes stop_codon:yes gene_type:complete
MTKRIQLSERNLIKLIHNVISEQGQSPCNDPNSPYNTNFPEFCYVQNGVYVHQQPGMSYHNHPDARCCGPIDRVNTTSGGPDVYWDCVNGNCEQGGTQFATEQDCEDSNCEERARPGGYGGGKNNMARIKARALSEQRMRRIVRKVVNEIKRY